MHIRFPVFGLIASVVLGVLVAGVATSGADKESARVELSPHAAALELVFKVEKARIREIDKADWWHDVEERTWSVKRPFAPGTIDSTHLFQVGYRIGGKKAAAWLVDTAKGEVQREPE